MWLPTDAPIVIVRLLGPHGFYPSYAIERPTQLFIPAPEGPWCAVIQAPLPEEWEIGEVTALAPEEVRLLAAITLSEPDPWTNGRPIITHWVEGPVEIEGVSDLTSPELRGRVEEAVTKLRGQSNSSSAPRAPYAPPREFRIAEIGRLSDALDLLDSIDCSDQLLLAGLARLLGGTRLMFAAHEMEEGALCLFVSMNAGLEFVRQYLSDQLQRDASFSEVHEYLTDIYPDGSRIAELYEYMYEHRLAATHPANRLGEFWAPPLMADDVYHLQKNLIVLYRHIILGELPQFDW